MSSLVDLLLDRPETLNHSDAVLQTASHRISELLKCICNSTLLISKISPHLCRLLNNVEQKVIKTYFNFVAKDRL